MFGKYFKPFGRFAIMAIPAENSKAVDESLQRLHGMEDAVVLDALFERPSAVRSIVDSINQKIDGPDLSDENLTEILERLQKRKFVESVQTKEGTLWYLTKAAYEVKHQEAIRDLRAEKRFYYKRVNVLIRNKNGSNYIL